MSTVDTVKEVVKDTLVGHEDQPPESSSHYKAKFNKFAKKDAETGELFLGPEEFVDAVAPSDEDYVGASLLLFALL
jgi:solute carrier family 25 aspartate/glutamate transporter 12/13